MPRPRRLVPLVLLLVLGSCAKAPPTLSPQATRAFYNTRVIKGLDLLRDTAIDANAQTPPLLSTAKTRELVEYHASALQVIHATSVGWQATVLAGLDAVVAGLAPQERTIVAPYVALVKTILAEVPR